ALTPNSPAAFWRPSKESWLNDLSLKPPASETTQGLKPSTGLIVWTGVVALAAPPSPGASAHAASASAATAATAVSLMVLFTRISSADLSDVARRCRRGVADGHRRPSRHFSPGSVVTRL